MTLTVGSLFSGIGGLDLGLERAGMRVIWQSENDPYASRVLAKHWPDVPNLGDITKIDWSGVERPDLVCGGFPCQPVSVAGRGLAQLDERWLWPEYARCLRELRPRLVLVENVPGLLVRGMGDVLGDLAALGYDAEWDCVPAAAVGAPHLRWRVFIVAHAHGERLEERGLPAEGGEDFPDPARSGRGCEGAGHVAEATVRGEASDHPGNSGGPLADASGSGWLGTVDAEPGSGSASLGGTADSVFGGRGQPERRAWWDAEPDVGRVANGVPRRVDRLRTLGNAVVPQVAEHVGRLILGRYALHLTCTSSAAEFDQHKRSEAP